MHDDPKDEIESTDKVHAINFEISSRGRIESKSSYTRNDEIIHNSHDRFKLKLKSNQ